MGCGASNTAGGAPSGPGSPVAERYAPAPAPDAAPPAPAPAPAPSAPAPVAVPAPSVSGDAPAPSTAYIFAMLQKQEGATEVDKKEAGRYIKALAGCYARFDGTGPPPPPDPKVPQVLKELSEAPGTLDGAGFASELGKLPGLLEKIQADWDSAAGKLVKFRSCEEQLSKLFGNLDRLRQRQSNGEKVDEVVESRKRQVKKMRSNGVVPSAGICVFNQIDVDKSRTIDIAELKRAFKSLRAVYPAGEEEVATMLATLDTDSSGEIDEVEWVQNLEKLPALKAALEADLDPDTGKLRSYRTPRQQFAKLLANIDRLEYDATKGKDVAAELASRRAQANRMRMAGIHPSAGIVVFAQLDKKKAGQISKEQLTKLFDKMAFDGKSVDEVMTKLDTDKDGFVSEKEWLEGLDKVPTLKMALEKDIDPETGKLRSLITSGKAMFDMLRRQEGVYAVDKKEVGRMLKALNAVYKPDDGSMDMGVDDIADELIAAGKEKMTPDEWLTTLATMPTLDEKLKADYDSDRVRFNSFRSCGQQLSKLLGNLDRLRYRERQGEDCSAEIATRKAQVKKMRSHGIVPSPALCVFNQIDVDKSGTMSHDELGRLLKQLKAVYRISESEVHMMDTLDTDASGDVDEVEWCRNLANLPSLKSALQKDLDPDTGRLKSFRTPRQQFAKLLANIDRLEYDVTKAERHSDNMRALVAELTSRREEAQRFRVAGITPSAGIVVFAQLDKKKAGQISKEQLTKLFDKMAFDGKSVEEVMTKLDTDKDGTISEKEWLDGLDAVPSLKAALEKDIDPETGKLKSLITSGKAVFDMLRRQEGAYAVDKNEVARFLSALNAVYKPEDPGLKKLHDEYVAAGKEKLTPDEWLAALATMPTLDEKLKADYDSDRVRFNSFRSCGQQLSKLLGNLDRLRYRERQGEDCSAEIVTRKAQVKKMQKNAITPSAGLCVFNQIDVDKSGTISTDEFSRLLKGMKRLYKVSAAQEAEMVKILDSDGSGEIDIVEWCRNLYKAPGLKAALQKDLDPNTGRLKSFRTPRQQFAKLLANIDRLEYDVTKAERHSDNMRALVAELTSRREEAQRFRVAGVTPSAGIVVFAQLDKKKTRQITKEQLTKLFDKMAFDGKSVEEVMTKLDTDKDGTISEKEWLDGLDAVPSLKAALEKDIDPETGKLKSLITSGKAMFDMLRRQEGAYAVDKNEMARFLSALNSVFKIEGGEVTDVAAKLSEAGKEKMTPDEWLTTLATMPTLDEKLKADYDSDRVRFNSFRSCGQQLSKLLGNLDRLRVKLKTVPEEEKAGVEAQILSRKKQVKKMRTNGINPSPALCVFNQIDLDKSHTVSATELKRLLYGMRKVYPAGEAEIDKMVETMDTDSSGACRAAPSSSSAVRCLDLRMWRP
jgi:Ca2+-binding EF-hand superfamily protein